MPAYHEDWDAKISDFGLSKFGPANPKYTFDFSNASYEQNTINEIVYSEIKDEIHPESLKVFAAIAYQCLKGDRVERPLMSDILWELETALGYQVGLGGHIAWCGGVLVDTIHEGSDLERRNAFDFLRLGYDMRRTTSGYKNNNPVWKETFKFTLEKPAKAILKLAVLSDSSSWPRNNLKENLGDVDISVLDVVKEKHMNNVYNIGNGRIELQLEPSALPVKTKPKILQFIAGGNKAKNLAINVFGLQL
ncbi:hypothetical protein L1987_57645 [Smallanthus sonchifolius]|uniref:Uncharacterized protein n=1 Tax=Smallanthus sonchifolius TaxID=185202 RepID=A0ACB9DDA4_9ASTR|nr:hypothetical protein L1987_57645 [Smallanthus sonchifolius]